MTPETHPRTIDLDAAPGRMSSIWAQAGFEVVGVDFSHVALGKARARAAEAGAECEFLLGDLTGDLPGVAGPFDLLVDYGTLDDLAPEVRPKMVAQVERLSRPGSELLLFCFHSTHEDLPKFSFTGPSRLVGAIDPDELGVLFGSAWERQDLMADAEHCY